MFCFSAISRVAGSGPMQGRERGNIESPACGSQHPAGYEAFSTHAVRHQIVKNLRWRPFRGRLGISWLLSEVLQAHLVKALQSPDGTPHPRMSGLARMLPQLSVEVQDSLGHFRDEPRTTIGAREALEKLGGVYGFRRAPAVGLSHPIKQLLGQFQVIEWLAAQRPPVLQGLQFFWCGLPESLRVAHITVLQDPCAFCEIQRPPDFLCSQQYESTHRFRSLLATPQGLQTPLQTTHTTC